MSAAMRSGTHRLPESEAELLQFRPSDHRDEVFPRRLLLPGERILYSTRPSLWRSAGWPTLLVVFFFVSSAFDALVALVLFVAPGYAGAPVAESFLLAGGFGALLWGGVLAVLLRSKSRSAYALTNLRVLAIRGLGGTDFRSIPWPRVARLYLPSRLGATVVFESARSGPSDTLGAAGSKEVRWVGLRSATQAYEFAQTAFAVAAASAAAAQRTLAKESRVLRDRVECVYCGNLVLTAGEDVSKALCPRCSAPLSRSLVAEAPELSAPAPSPTSESDHVRYLRPAVHLAREAIEWYQPLPVVWALVSVLVAIFFASSSTGPIPSSALTVSSGLVLVLLAAIGYILWGQTVRKWSAVVRALRDSLPEGSPWQRTLADPLRRWNHVVRIGYLTSLLIPLAAWLAESTYSASTPQPAAMNSWDLLTIPLAAVGWAGSLIASQVALVVSIPRIATGSGVSYVDQQLRRGQQRAALSLAAAVAVPLVLAYFALAPSTDVAWSYLALVGAVGAAGLAWGLAALAAALAQWSELAEHVVDRDASAAGSTPYTTPVGSGGPGRVAAPAWAAPATWASRAWRTSPYGRWTVALLAFSGVLIVAVLLSLSGVLTPWLERGTGSGPPPPTLPPPIIVATPGTTWAIPVNHYEFQSFRNNQSGVISGSFSSDGPVIGYIMDSNDYSIWQVVGHVVYDEYSTGNVTHGGFDLSLNFTDRWYVVVVNESPNSTVSVTWLTECQVSFRA